MPEPIPFTCIYSGEADFLVDGVVLAQWAGCSRARIDERALARVVHRVGPGRYRLRASLRALLAASRMAKRRATLTAALARAEALPHPATA
jgi:hypothetical protein